MGENIYLIGFMGTGKSTVCRCLNREYGRSIVEMDEQIEKDQGCAISRIFAEKGEEYFRSLETELLKSMEKGTGLVVSCGGGVALRRENVALMKERGKIVLLRARPKTVYERVRHTHDRPLLEGNMTVEHIRHLMEKRLPAYESAADYIVDTDGRPAQEIAREILGLFI